MLDFVGLNDIQYLVSFDNIQLSLNLKLNVIGRIQSSDLTTNSRCNHSNSRSKLLMSWSKDYNFGSEVFPIYLQVQAQNRKLKLSIQSVRTLSDPTKGIQLRIWFGHLTSLVVMMMKILQMLGLSLEVGYFIWRIMWPKLWAQNLMF